MKNKLSLAMCTYNGELYLPEQLNSIIKQTLLPDELVVCDDGSTDQTLKIIEDFREKASFPIRIFKNEKRLGVTKNFEKAIRLCTGDIIMLSDQDDEWDLHKLEKTERSFKENPEAGYVFSNASIVNQQLQPQGYTMWDSIPFTKQQRKRFLQGYQLELLLKYNVVTGNTMAFRSELKDKILPISELWIQDEWIALIGSSIGKKGFLIDDTLVRYRQHSKQMLGGKRTNLFEKAKKAKLMDAKYFNLQKNRFSQIEDRIKILPSFVNEDISNQISLKIRHMDSRSIIRSRGRIIRIPLILKELFSLRYHRFSLGWVSVATDIFL